MPKTLKFVTTLFLILAITFGIHVSVLFVMELPLFSDRIVLSYGVNFLLATIIYLIIQQTLKKNGAQAGFIFMAGSALKFIVFFSAFYFHFGLRVLRYFSAFYPFYNQDDVMQKTEFTAFFIPYAVCLILEVAYLSKQLNNQTYSEENNE